MAAARHSPSWATAALQASRSPLIYSVAFLCLLSFLLCCFFFLLCNARVEKRSRGFHVNPEEEPSNPLHQLDCQGGFHLKPRGRTQASLDCRAIAHLVWHGGVPLETPRKNPTATPGSGFSLRFLRLPLMRNHLLTTLSQFPHTEGDKCNVLEI